MSPRPHRPLPPFRSLRPAALTALACGAAVVALTGVPGTATGTTAPAASPARAHVRELTVVPRHFHQVDLPPDGDSVGDEIVDLFPIRGAEHRIGTLTQVCVLVSAARELAQCHGSLDLPHGRLEIGGAVDGSRVTTMAVTGGTGRFRGAAGTVRFVPRGERIDARLQLGAGR